MELKPYQSEVISDLEDFLEHLENSPSAEQAYTNYWETKLGVKGGQGELFGAGISPYQDHLGAPHVAIKVPTAGGKTFIAVNALHSIEQKFWQGQGAKAVVWLVPWSNLLQQTVKNLSDAHHPYRIRLNTLFRGRVEVYQKDELLHGVNFSPSAILDQLSIFVFNFSSLRINTRSKEDRKIYQENGNLEPFSSLIDPTDLLEGTEPSALINVIRSLRPVVIVDESHNAGSQLSIEMLQRLNPSFVLDLTATPRENSNVISYTNALALKKENMVKLPVVVYNHQKKEELIANALHLRKQLEMVASRTNGSIRPIILFQAQSNIKGKDNLTFQRIKQKLIRLKIPEEQIKIKTSDLDELRGVDLMAKDCPVRYIITVNALKEGWDCPNAYILASLADRSSPIDVTQILGRILRQPYTAKNENFELNLSYVLTSSVQFQETIDNVVKALQQTGFSRNDYYAEEGAVVEEAEEMKNLEELGEGQIDPQSLSSTNEGGESEPIDENFFNPDAVAFYAQDNPQNLAQNTPLNHMLERAKENHQRFEEQVQNTYDENSLFAEIKQKEVKKYKIIEPYQEIAQKIKLPQFFIEDENPIRSLAFPELDPEWQFLRQDSLLAEFKLSECNTALNFVDLQQEITAIDYDEQRKGVIVRTINNKIKENLIKLISELPSEKKIEELSASIIQKLGRFDAIADQELKKFVNRVFENLSNEQILEVIENDFLYVEKIKEKIKNLAADYRKKRFKSLIDQNRISTQPNFSLPESILPFTLSTALEKSLYEREGGMNQFERSIIPQVASLENITFWHRNLERSKGFCLNGDINHYPDFIITTQRKNTILLETKGDHLLTNEDSQSKNELGKIWANLAGQNFKYFMVSQTKIAPNIYTKNEIIPILENL